MKCATMVPEGKGLLEVFLENVTLREAIPVTNCASFLTRSSFISHLLLSSPHRLGVT